MCTRTADDLGIEPRKYTVLLPFAGGHATKHAYSGKEKPVPLLFNEALEESLTRLDDRHGFNVSPLLKDVQDTSEKLFDVVLDSFHILMGNKASADFSTHVFVHGRVTQQGTGGVVDLQIVQQEQLLPRLPPVALPDVRSWTVHRRKWQRRSITRDATRRGGQRCLEHFTVAPAETTCERIFGAPLPPAPSPHARTLTLVALLIRQVQRVGGQRVGDAASHSV